MGDARALVFILNCAKLLLNVKLEVNWLDDIAYRSENGLDH